ncbi:autotransporter domain-containing protein [Devosia sediminis]|uniref:Autotransporter domain-containing protein n=1 Tax=Devosia sediminis TaxID=2798801 RepID=A0A934IQU1_9HYPH|nr:autotransporter domain-containing protein [Devosia sediminis]MBJ3783501.1 autotransporter domain-containing protein [Devosia sediminis]
MTRRTFSRTKRRNEGRWLLAGLLMATTALVMIPEAEAQARIDRIIGNVGWTNSIGVETMSGNGAYIGGVLQNVNSGQMRATRWGMDGAALELDASIGASSYLTGLSWDGSVAAGFSNFINSPGAFRWTEAGGVEYIGSLGGNRSVAYDISNDGEVIVGFARRTDGLDKRFVWIKDATTGVVTNPQMYELISATSAFNVEIGGISGNGRYVAGAEDSLPGYVAYRYDISDIESGVVTHLALGHLGGDWAVTRDLSTDGRVIVGYSEQDVAQGGNYRAFRWVEGATGGYNGGAMYDLGTLGGDRSYAFAVSGDGNVAVGQAETAGAEYIAFRWAEETGMLAVADWLRAAGVNVDNTLVNASATNDDGSIVSGILNNDDGEQEIYIARVAPPPAPGPNPNPNPGPQPGTGLMNVSEYQQTLYAGAGGIASAGEFLSWLPMNGAHHRPLMLTPELDGDMCAWATGDFAHHGGTSMGIGLAEVGACTDLAGGAVRIGGAVGTTRSWQDLALGGSSRMAGQYVLGEVDWQPDGTPLLLSVTGMLGGWQANVDRAYSNGADTAISSGQTNAMGGVVRLRADWLEAATLGNTTINPWTSVSVGALHVDGYAESGGPFPARFNAQDLSHVDVRLGLTAITEISTQTKLSTTFEVAHRTGSAPTASGQVDGLFAFSLGGGQQSNTWLRVGAELDHKINESLSLSGSVHFATAGRDPSVAGSIGLKGAF